MQIEAILFLLTVYFLMRSILVAQQDIRQEICKAHHKVYVVHFFHDDSPSILSVHEQMVMAIPESPATVSGTPKIHSIPSQQCHKRL